MTHRAWFWCLCACSSVYNGFTISEYTNFRGGAVSVCVCVCVCVCMYVCVCMCVCVLPGFQPCLTFAAERVSRAELRAVSLGGPADRRRGGRRHQGGQPHVPGGGAGRLEARPLQRHVSGGGGRRVCAGVFQVCAWGGAGPMEARPLQRHVSEVGGLRGLCAVCM